ncbi:MAG: PAS domain S-box protein [Bacteroidales bacterium]|nr:PAS domain S-box protein [Bacteroidales bacterium]
MEISYKRKSGEIIYGLVSAVIVDFQDEKCAYVVFYNISDLKRNEFKLKQTAEEFRLVFENSSDAIFWANSDNGIILNCNRRAEELLALNRDEIIGQEHWRIHPEKDKEMYQSLFSDIKITNPGGLELEVQRSDGKLIPVSISVATISLGNFSITQAIVHDISERIENERKLKESEARYRAIVKNAPVAIFEIDQHGKFILLDGKGLTNMSTSSNWAEGKSLFELLTDKPEYVEKVKNALDGKEQKFMMELDDLALETYFSPVLDEKGITRSFIGVTVDISEKLKAEKKTFAGKKYVTSDDRCYTRPYLCKRYG